jgi:ATP-dependent Clp protease adaptor protein ClpS
MIRCPSPFFVGQSSHIDAAIPYNAEPPSSKCTRAMSEDGDKPGDDNETGVVVRTKPKTKKPSLYKVLMLNDDYTPMEFVVHILETFFRKSREEATQVMLNVHQRGIGVCGVYTYEVAETKVTEVVECARRQEHPLQLTLEKD